MNENVEAIDAKEMVLNRKFFTKYILQCTSELEKIAATNDDIELSFHTANLFCLTNFCKTLLNMQLQVIDPLQKVILKKKYCEEEKQICIDFKETLEKYNEVYSFTQRTIHPFHNILLSRIQSYEEKENELEKKIAERPQDQSYIDLLKVSNIVSDNMKWYKVIVIHSSKYISTMITKVSFFYKKICLYT